MAHYLLVSSGFNSRSRKGATRELMALVGGDVVSIHAPVRERHRAGCIARKKLLFQFTLP